MCASLHVRIGEKDNERRGIGKKYSQTSGLILGEEISCFLFKVKLITSEYVLIYDNNCFDVVEFEFIYFDSYEHYIIRIEVCGIKRRVNIRST